jgi:hypothetical protein
MQVIREDDVLRQAFVPGNLIGFQNSVEIFADRLVLDVAEDQPSLGYLEIWSPLFCHALWFMLDRCDTGKCLQQSLQRRSVRMLRFRIDCRLTKSEQVAVKDIFI